MWPVDSGQQTRDQSTISSGSIANSKFSVQSCLLICAVCKFRFIGTNRSSVRFFLRSCPVNLSSSSEYSSTSSSSSFTSSEGHPPSNPHSFSAITEPNSAAGPPSCPNPPPPSSSSPAQSSFRWPSSVNHQLAPLQFTPRRPTPVRYLSRPLPHPDSLSTPLAFWGTPADHRAAIRPQPPAGTRTLLTLPDKDASAILRQVRRDRLSRRHQQRKFCHKCGTRFNSAKTFGDHIRSRKHLRNKQEPDLVS